MDLWLANILFSLGISLLLTGVIIPQILLIAFRKKLFDEPDARKIHTSVVPRLGGIAFMPAIFFSIISVCGFAMLHEPLGFNSVESQWVVQFCFIACAILLMFLVGLADDLVGVKYRAKFVVQIISALMLVIGGLWIDNLHGFMWIHELSPYVGIPLTVVVIVFIINAINLIDGIDGLASGLSTIALLFYGIAFFSSGEYLYAMIAAATMGTLIPFFYYNVFGDPAKRKKIFMGDTGALTIGVVLSTLSLKMNDMGHPLEGLPTNTLVVAFSPLIVPCFDVIRVYFHRIFRHRNPFLPDKCHIHHKFLALGMPQRAAMMSILIVSASFIIINVLVSPYININMLVIIDLFIWIVANVWMTKSIRRREKRLKLNSPLYE